jgi:hypothetical protein
MGDDDSAMQEAMRKQQEDLDRMQEEEKRKNKLAQTKTLKNIRTSAGGGGSGFSSGNRDTLG